MAEAEKVKPIKYTGKNDEGEVITSQKGPDADTYLNPEEVSAAIDHVVEVFNDAFVNEGSSVVNQLRSVIGDSEEAVIVKGLKMTETIEQTADAIAGIPGQVEEQLAPYKKAALNARNEIQNQINDEVKKQVSGTAGVTHVEEGA